MSAANLTRRVTRPSAGLVFLAAVLLLAGGVTPWANDDVVATIGEQSVQRAELLTVASFSLEQTELERLRCQVEADRSHAEVLQTFLRQLVHERLLDLEAGRTGMTVEAILASVYESVPQIEDSEVAAFYRENQSRIPYALGAVAGQIRDFLRQQAEQQAEAEFLGVLEQRFAVDYRLEPFRVDIAADGFATLGPQDAPVTIVEFSDFECPYCARVQPALQRAKREYGDRLRIVYRHYPLADIHANAQKAAEASLCAGEQAMFWEMHDLMFAEQAALSVPDLKDKAGRIGLDRAAFDACLDSGRHHETVRDDIRAGAVAGVSGTPALFVNGRPLTGAAPFETIAATIDDELERLGVR